ncbi:CD4-2 molecule, tandem duplicate 2 isoform X2 [Chelmon rostratus]|uniref:CD4-2 molecule, tandem duplicate 2 isoform X2 n=1 Tax=Chelmon rostratus TaxID=109905 RepID=UPI001BE7EB2D|nr:CD4-2 molecule, tandem duplicate 2 isoform X2 [Chelmon rostratus]
MFLFYHFLLTEMHICLHFTSFDPTFKMKIAVWFVLVLGALSAAGDVFLTKPGQSATLKCGVNNFVNSLEWRNEKDRIYSQDKGFPRRGQGDIADRSQLRNTNLRISGVKEQDAGKFTCEVDGTAREHTLLVVSVSVSSSADLRLGGTATLQCQVKGLSPDSTVQWKRPDGRPHKGSQIVQLYPLARSDVGTWICVISHAGKTFNESLDIKVAEPAHTTPAPVPPKSTKDNRAAAPSSKLGLSWWMWVVIGVGCAVVLLLMAFVVCLCKRIKRRRRKLRKMKNGRQRLKPEQYCQSQQLQQNRSKDAGERSHQPPLCNPS